MATRATTLFSLATVKAYLDLTPTTHDVALTQLADRVSEFIEGETGVLFVTRTVEDVYDGTGRATLRLDRYPITSLTSLTIKDTQDGTPKTITSSDYDLDLARGIVRLRTTADPSVFTALFQNVAVSYPVGYGAQDAATLPGDIYGAGLDLVKYLWTQFRTNAVAASQISVGPGNVFIKPDLPVEIRRTLDAWRRPVVV